MKLESSTFQCDLSWDPIVELKIKQHFSEFLKNQNRVHGCLQSFTFPESYNEQASLAVGACLSDVYRGAGCTLLGGDTSTGKSLIITMIALKE